MKKCRKCGRLLPLDEFYKHSKMADGHLNICKACTKDRVAKHREENLEVVRAYDRKRCHLEKRKKLRSAISKRRRQEVGYGKVHLAVLRAVKKGAIHKPDGCQCCGRTGRLEAHHNNYEEALNVMWLCAECHRNYHIGKTARAEQIRTVVNDFFRKEDAHACTC